MLPVIWDAVLRSINREHCKDPMDFAIGTGDHIQTDLEQELKWFIEIANGYVSAEYRERVEQGTGKPVEPEGLGLPWYAALGNHDVGWEGGFNNDMLIQEGGSVLAAEDASRLSDQPETIEAYRTVEENNENIEGRPYWHGFANMPEGYPKEGYSSFDPNPYIHCIVLNTSNYSPEGNIPVSTASGGALDERQFEWMKQEIEASPDKLCLVFSHHKAEHISETHTGQPFYMSANPPVFFPGYVHGEELKDTLISYKNVIAFINGHSHSNRLDPEGNTWDTSGGYWNINTCAVVDWPQEWRRITIWDNGDGTGVICCRMFQHKNQECHDVAYVANSDRPGEPKDRDVNLLFPIPQAVAENIIKRLPEKATVDESNECFIATAAFGSKIEPEVVMLRKFRDQKLQQYFLGRLFIKTYYRISPYIAKFISDKPHIRALVRAALQPLIISISRSKFL